MQKSVEERVELFRKFYNRENGRKVLGFFLGSEYPLFRYEAAKKLPQKAALTPGDFNVDEYLEDYDRLYKIHESCGGDAIFSASAFWGIPWLEAMMGCPIYADHKSGSIYAAKPDKINTRFDPDNSWAKLCREFLVKASERSGGRYPLATTRMRGVSDLLAAVYGQDDIVYKMFDQEDEVKELARLLARFITDFSKFQLDYIPDFYGGIGSFYYHCYAPAKTVWLQEDSVALLSPDLFEEFIEPCDRMIIDELKSCIMHTHSAGYLPWQKYVDMGVAAMELHIDKGGPDAEELNAIHKGICSQKPLIIWGDISEKDLDYLFENLTDRGVAIMVYTDDVQKAQRLYTKYNGR